jgi:hypothetical protein
MNGSRNGLDDFREISKESHSNTLFGIGSIRILSCSFPLVGVRQRQCLPKGIGWARPGVADSEWQCDG